MEKKRIDYVDLVKGISIFLVVWVHTSHPGWLTFILVNSIFFMLAGFFFKRKPIKLFLKEKVKYLLLPFTFFYLLSYPFRLLLHFWDHRCFDGFNWNCIWDVFTISERTDYLSVNVPLWFILCLFVIQLLYYGISFLPRKIILLIGVAAILLKEILNGIPSMFMVNAAFYYIGFFILGNLSGKSVIEAFHHLKHKLLIAFSALATICLISLSGTFLDASPVAPVTEAVSLFSVLLLLLFVCSWGNDRKALRLPKFYGVNTLAVLGYHVPVLIFIKRISNAIFHTSTPLLGFIHCIITLFLLFFIIKWSNRYIPLLVGKKK